MIRYDTLDSSSNINPQMLNKKNQKTVPISLLSGGNSFFVKIKSNNIASNYNDTGNKIKPYPLQKINNIYYKKEDNNKTYNKYLNNSQPKNSFLFTVNNSIEYNNTKNSVINKTKQDSSNHYKDIYSSSSIRNNNDNINNKSIYSNSFRHNYNEVLLTDVEIFKKNINKNHNINDDKSEYRKINKIKNENINNTYNSKYNKRIINATKNRSNNNVISNSLNRKIKTLTENNSILTDKIKYQSKTNHIKLIKKNQNNQNILKYNTKNKNLTNILFNNNSIIDRDKNKSHEKNNFSEEKSQIIYHGIRKEKRDYSKELNYNNNSIISTNNNLFTKNILEVNELNTNASKRKIEKRMKSINTQPNNESLKIYNNNNSKKNYNSINNKSLVVTKKNYEKNNEKNILNKNLNNNKNIKLKNSYISGDILNINYTLTQLIGPNSNTSNRKMSKQKNNIDNNKYTIKKTQEKNNNQKDYKIGNSYISSGIGPSNADKKKNNNYPSIIINNNYMYNYIPFVTLNNSVDNNKKSLSLNKNSLFDKNLEKKVYNMNNYSMNIKPVLNNTHNLKIEHSQAYIYSSFIENNSKNISNISNINSISKENKNKISKRYKNNQEMEINIEDNNSKNYNINNHLYNYQPKHISSNLIDEINNINKTSGNDYCLFMNKLNSNNITECYVSKEKKNKQKQNPPLSKNPKKLNILSLIQENNRKSRDKNTHLQQQFHSFAQNDNYNRYNRNKNIYETIDYILYPDSYKIKEKTEVLDNFDDMNSIIRRINFDKIDLKNANIFTVNDGDNSSIPKDKNYLYKKYSETFNSFFDKKYINHKNMSANKNKKNNYFCQSKQSGSTKDSNKDGYSTKKLRVFINVENRSEGKKIN